MSERVQIGQIVGAFGIKGQVKVESQTSFDSRFDAGNAVWIRGTRYTIKKSQFHKGRFLLTLPGITTMSQAEALQWEPVEAEGEPELDDDEYFVHDLVGLRAISPGGEEIGTVTAIDDYPAHQVLVIDGTILVPLVSEFIRGVDLEQGTMTVQLIYGMRPGEL